MQCNFSTLSELYTFLFPNLICPCRGLRLKSWDLSFHANIDPNNQRQCVMDAYQGRSLKLSMKSRQLTFGMNMKPNTTVPAVEKPRLLIVPPTLMKSLRAKVITITRTRIMLVMQMIADISLESLRPLILTFLMLNARMIAIACNTILQPQIIPRKTNRLGEKHTETLYITSNPSPCHLRKTMRQHHESTIAIKALENHLTHATMI